MSEQQTLKSAISKVAEKLSNKPEIVETKPSPPKPAELRPERSSESKPAESQATPLKGDAKSALEKRKQMMREGLPRTNAASTIQAIGDKFKSLNDMRRERELANLERGKETLAGAIASGDKALVRAALVSFFDLCPDDLEIEHACPSLSARELRNAHGVDYLIGQALLLLCDGSETNRTQILESLETEFKGPLYGYIDFLRNNPEIDKISNREGNEKILLGQHLLYDETMSQPERRLLEYMKRRHEI